MQNSLYPYFTLYFKNSLWTIDFSVDHRLLLRKETKYLPVRLDNYFLDSCPIKKKTNIGFMKENERTARKYL